MVQISTPWEWALFVKLLWPFVIIIIIKNECHSDIIVDRLQGCSHSKKLRETESESRSSKVVCALCAMWNYLISYSVCWLEREVMIGGLLWRHCHCIMLCFSFFFFAFLFAFLFVIVYFVCDYNNNNWNAIVYDGMVTCWKRMTVSGLISNVWI